MTKKLYITIGIYVLSFASLMAQTQMPSWALNGRQIRFATNGLVIENTPATVTGANGASGAYYDANGIRLFHVIDNQVFFGNSATAAGTLFVDNTPEEADVIENEMIIVPSRKIPCESSSYYVIYILHQRWNDDPRPPRTEEFSSRIQVCYNEITIVSGSLLIGTRRVISTIFSDQDNSAMGKRFKTGMALSNFMTDGTRRLYVVSGGIINIPSIFQPLSKIQLFNIGANTIIEDQTAAATTLYQDVTSDLGAGEVELTADNSLLGFSCFRKTTASYSSTTNNDADVVLVYLNPTTGQINTTAPNTNNGIRKIKIANSPLSSHFTGFEFNADPVDRYFFVGRSGVGIYSYHLNANTATLFTLPVPSLISNYSNSSIELSRLGRMYAVNNANNQLLEILDYETVIELDPYPIGIGAISSIVGSEAAPFFYSLPDQVDGYNYPANMASTAITPMAGVIFPAGSNNVEITNINPASLTTVNWTTTSNPFTSNGVAITQIFLPGDLIIKPNTRLNITGLTIHFATDREVQMNAGATSTAKGSKLYLTNSTLTSCSLMWQGVDATGNANYVQGSTPLNSPQPFVSMVNSTIEYALAGIDAANGGIVQATNSNFTNNVAGVGFSNYQNSTFSTSFFRNCNFVTNINLYNRNQTPTTHVSLSGTKSVNFGGCNFENTTTIAQRPMNATRGYGIVSYYSDVTIEAICSSGNVPCTGTYDRGNFNNLFYGVLALGGNFVKIERTNFLDNSGGAWIVSNNGLSTTLCDFKSRFDINLSFGLYLESCTGYQVEENYFHDGGYGLAVYNSGVVENKIYFNNFHQTIVSATAIGTNAEKTPGLQFICNDFDTTAFALANLIGTINTLNGPVSITSSRIRTQQGINILNNQLIGADNTFWLHGAPITDGNDFSNSGDQFSYYGATDNMPNRDAKLNSLYGSISNYSNLTFTTREQECPSNLGTGGVGPMFSVATIGTLNQQEMQTETEISTLTKNINEVELLIAAETANQNNTNIVQEKLTKAAPYVPDDALKTYLFNENVSEYSRSSVMIANSPLPSSVKEEIDNSNLSPTLKWYVNQRQNGVNLIEQKKEQIESYKSAKQVIVDNLVRDAYQKDLAETTNTLIATLENQKETHSKERLADLYAWKGLYSKADGILCDLEQMAIDQKDEEALKLVKINQLKLLVKQNAANMVSVITEQSDYLHQLAADYNTKSGGDARSMLMAAGLETYEPIILLPSANTAKSASANNQNTKKEEFKPDFSRLFKIYPNPVNEQLAIEFICADENCTFDIYNISGQKVRTINSNSRLGYLSINVSDLPNGNYIVKCPQLNAQNSFVVSR